MSTTQRVLTLPVLIPPLKVQLRSEVRGGILASVNSVCLGTEVTQQVSDEPDPGSCPGQRVTLTSVGKFNTHSHK